MSKEEDPKTIEELLNSGIFGNRAEEVKRAIKGGYR
jgi:Arc/MetJ-type ribon-helix-helix transcriptional regulator